MPPKAPRRTPLPIVDKIDAALSEIVRAETKRSPILAALMLNIADQESAAMVVTTLRAAADEIEAFAKSLPAESPEMARIRTILRDASRTRSLADYLPKG